MEHLDGWMVSLVGVFLSLLLGIIAFFLRRILVQFDELNRKVGEVNETMLKIDKDLSGRVAVLDAEHEQVKVRIQALDPLFDRVRAVETGLAKLEAGGCRHAERCGQ